MGQKRGKIVMVEHLIEIKNLKKEYSSGGSVVPAIRNMDINIDDGEFISIMGPSGSGKSSLLSVLGGLNKPTDGSVLVDSIDINNLNSEQRADFRSEYIGFIFQSFQLVNYLTVLENIMLPMAVTDIKSKTQEEMAMAVLEKTGLKDKFNRLPDQLSGGEQERVAIARAIVNKPPILLADEPTGNLDSDTSKDIMELLQRFNRDGQTIVMVSHDPETCNYSSRVIKVRDGGVE